MGSSSSSSVHDISRPGVSAAAATAGAAPHHLELAPQSRFRDDGPSLAAKPQQVPTSVLAPMTTPALAQEAGSEATRSSQSSSSSRSRFRKDGFHSRGCRTAGSEADRSSQSSTIRSRCHDDGRPFQRKPDHRIGSRPQLSKQHQEPKPMPQ